MTHTARLYRLMHRVTTWCLRNTDSIRLWMAYARAVPKRRLNSAEKVLILPIKIWAAMFALGTLIALVA
jgi:hypothetical protein